MGFEFEQDARTMRTALAERLARFGLTLHPDKTRVLRFGRFALRDSTRDGRRRPETFDFLGFTHISGESKEGQFRTLRRTSRKKRQAKLAALTREAWRRMLDPEPEQYRWLCAVLRGHDQYYGVPGNYRALRSFHARVRDIWHRVLQHRSQRARWTAERRARFDAHLPLPSPPYHASSTFHSVRAAVDRRWEPGAGNPLAGFCAGGGPKGPSLPRHGGAARRAGFVLMGTGHPWMSAGYTRLSAGYTRLSAAYAWTSAGHPLDEHWPSMDERWLHAGERWLHADDGRPA